MGVMIRAWLQARATGPFSVKLPLLIAASAHVRQAKGKVATKMMAKYTMNSVRGGLWLRATGPGMVEGGTWTIDPRGAVDVDHVRVRGHEYHHDGNY